MLALFLVVSGPVLAACSSGDGGSRETLYIGGIPDQDTALLVRRFDGIADYLGDRLDVSAKYVPSVDYAAVVTGFRNNDIHLAWFGGLTGVQARSAVPGAEAIAQRPIDAEFRSVFVVQKNTAAATLEELKGLTFTFGSESSTSGHLMPRHFLVSAGVDPEEDFNGLPNFSGSHDRTWKLVESGAFQAGGLSESVWSRAVSEGRVDLSKVRVLQTTPSYFDYNWTVRPDLDKSFGAGFSSKLKAALLDMGADPALRETLQLFGSDLFIATNNDKYKAIEDVASHLGMVE